MVVLGYIKFRKKYEVDATDICEDALAVAESNMKMNEANINLIKSDYMKISLRNTI